MSNGSEHIREENPRCEHATDDPGWGGLRQPVTHAEQAPDYKALIAEAREWPREGVNEGPLINDLADAVEALAEGRDRWRDALLSARRAHAAERVVLVESIKRAEAERDALRTQVAELRAVIEKVREARANHPACDKYLDDDPITCGWKRAVLDIDAALSAVPSGVLAERDADKWDEGAAAEHQAHFYGYLPHPQNPYRKGTHHE